MAKKAQSPKLQTTWNLTPLFKSDNDPRIAKNLQEVEEAVEKFVKKWQKRTDYLTDPKVLKTVLDEYEKLIFHFGSSGDAGYYFELRSSQDSASPVLKAKTNKTSDESNKNLNNFQFFELNLAKIDPKLQIKFLNDKNLQPYNHFLKKIFDQSAYMLTDAEEKILNLTSQPAKEYWVRMTQSFLSTEERDVLNEKGKKETKSFSEIMSLLSDKNKKVRDSANAAFNDILTKHLPVATEEMNAIMADKKISDDLRKMPRPDLSRLLSDDIDPKTVDTLLIAVSARNDIANRFYKLKAKMMGVSKLQYHERNVEYGKITKEYPFSDARKLVNKVFENLDPQFAQIFNQFLDNGQVDIYPRKGKRSNAACWHNLPSQPSYILLNHDNKLNDVMTIAHEFGHGINNELMRAKQNSLSFSTPVSTAEVASVFMEDFVLEEILKGADDEERLAILMMRLNDEISTVFRQVACYQFEQEMHNSFREKGYLSKEEIGQIFQKHMKTYMGPGVEQSPGAQNWWVYWTHIREFFYVYSYVGGGLISKSLRSQVRKDPKFIEGVKEFLAAGTSKSPKDIFMELGIDITQRRFWDQGLAEIEETLKETEKLAKKLGKI